MLSIGMFKDKHKQVIIHAISSDEDNESKTKREPNKHKIIRKPQPTLKRKSVHEPIIKPNTFKEYAESKEFLNQ